ncbi:MAG: hypothetical protein P8Y49_10155 [Sulfurovaceae bacterium]
MAKRVKFGDVIEIVTSKGYAYAQYTHKDSMMGALLRIFKGIYVKKQPSIRSSHEGVMAISRMGDQI